MTWYDGRTVLITGATGSIGSAFARLLAPAGARLVLTGRREERLAEVAAECRRHGAEVVSIRHDMGTLGAAGELARRVTDDTGSVDILINNAGFAKMGPFVEHPATAYEELCTVNVTNLVSLARHLLPGMLERGHGGVLNVASASAFLPLPHLATYAASKAFVKRFSEALHAELKPQGVHVTCLAPGAVESDTFFERASMDRPAGGVPAMSAEKAARAGLKALARNQRLMAVGVFDKFLSVAPGLVPTSLTLFLARHFVARARVG